MKNIVYIYMRSDPGPLLSVFTWKVKLDGAVNKSQFKSWFINIISVTKSRFLGVGSGEINNQ